MTADESRPWQGPASNVNGAADAPRLGSSAVVVAGSLSSLSLLELALAWADRAVPVVPLHHPFWPHNGTVRCSCRRGADCGRSIGKHPRTEHGVSDASTDETVIREWWDRWPKANLGLATGFAFDVLDIDGEQGIASIQRLIAEGKLPPALQARHQTGRDDPYGEHWLLTASGRGSSSIGYPGLDYKGLGGQVVAPGSIHYTGRRYRVLPGDGVMSGSAAAERLLRAARHLRAVR